MEVCEECASASKCQASASVSANAGYKIDAYQIVEVPGDVGFGAHARVCLCESSNVSHSAYQLECWQ